MFTQLSKANSKQTPLSGRALILYFSLLERFVIAGEPTTLHLTTGQLSELTGLAGWEVCLGRIELILAGCLCPVNFSPCDIKNTFRFVCLDLRQYTGEQANSTAESEVAAPRIASSAAGVNL